MLCLHVSGESNKREVGEKCKTPHGGHTGGAFSGLLEPQSQQKGEGGTKKIRKKFARYRLCVSSHLQENFLRRTSLNNRYSKGCT